MFQECPLFYKGNFVSSPSHTGVAENNPQLCQKLWFHCSSDLILLGIRSGIFYCFFDGGHTQEWGICLDSTGYLSWMQTCLLHSDHWALPSMGILPQAARKIGHLAFVEESGYITGLYCGASQILSTQAQWFLERIRILCSTQI